jgi:hypothetical protein
VDEQGIDVAALAASGARVAVLTPRINGRPASSSPPSADINRSAGLRM